MKALRTLLSVAVLGTMIAFSGCGGGGGNTEPIPDQQLGKLSKTWKLKNTNGGSVLYGSGVNQVDSTTNWTDFTLTITGTKGQTTFTYSTLGRPFRSVWKSTGSWQFGSDPKTLIIRDTGTDMTNITYSIDASNNLQLQFTYTGSGFTSRSSSVGGDWTFNLIPQ